MLEPQEDFDLQNFHQRIIDLLNKSGTKAQEACKKANIGRGAITTWKSSVPSVDKVYRLAKYLNRSLQWLLTGNDDVGLSENEQKLIDGFRLLDSRDQEDILGTVNMKIEKSKKGRELKTTEIAG